MSMSWRLFPILAFACAGMAGCLVKDRIDTWYLDASGTVSWTVMEKDVRSDAQADVDRQTEEATYMAAVRNQTHPIATAFAQLGALGPRTQILRGSVPYTIVTQGTFGKIDAFGLRLVGRLGLGGNSVLQQGPDGMQWTMTVRDPHAEALQTNDDDMKELIGGIQSLSVVLIEGRFVEAQGFRLSEDHRAANLEQASDATPGPEAGGLVVWRLKWK
jgi:hypothetical protein